MSEFGERLRKTRTSFHFRCGIPRMTHEDHVSGDYQLAHSEQIYVPYWEPNNTGWIDHRIRKDPEVAEKIAKTAPKTAAKWDFGTIEGLIACTDGVFVVNYFALREGPPERGPSFREEHPTIKRGPWPSGPEKKY